MLFEKRPLRVLMITSEYPSEQRPNAVPFIVRQVEHLKREGIDVEVFAFKGNKQFKNYARAWFQLMRVVAARKFDLVHAQWGHSAALALPKRLPWVITFRGNDLEGIVGADGKYTVKGKILRLVSRLMARLADERIVVSDSLGKHLDPAKGFTVIPSGLDLEIFRPMPKDYCRRKLGLPLDRRLVLFAASRLENPRKRFELAKRSVEKLKEKYPVELVVANNCGHSEIPAFMSACDVLLLTSVHEGSPNVVKEALACDLPVVSVDVGDVRERIGKIDGCMVCEDDSPETLSAALDEVLQRDTRIDGRSHVSDLDEKVITSHLLAVYRRALVGGPQHETVEREVIKSV